MARKREYLVRVPLESIDAHREYTVNATSEEDAIARLRKGEGRCRVEQIDYADPNWEESSAELDE